MISRSFDDDNFVLVASLDLSSAFDVVDINLLVKRLKIVGLPSDMIYLITVWLKDRFFYVSIDGMNSTMFEILLGTVQGPILYALFVAPLFDLETFLAFAYDKFIARID
jgi:hypothetical protein